MEIVFDIGKYPEARFTSGVVILAPRIICRQDMHYVLKRITAFNDKNRAGINKTLHRMSCLKNREDQIHKNSKMILIISGYFFLARSCFFPCFDFCSGFV